MVWCHRVLLVVLLAAAGQAELEKAQESYAGPTSIAHLKGHAKQMAKLAYEKLHHPFSSEQKRRAEKKEKKKKDGGQSAKNLLFKVGDTVCITEGKFVG